MSLADPAAWEVDGVAQASGPRVLLRGVSHTFGQGAAAVRALRDLDLYADKGEFVSLVGPSGCGKSTIFNIVAGLLQPTAGEVWVDGERGARTGRVGYMPQKDLLFPWRTVLDNTIVGLEVQGVPRREARQLALRHFERFGLSGFEAVYPAALSGGMRQRAALLRTVLFRPNAGPNGGRDDVRGGILLLDEPFGALDALTRAGMQEWLLDLWGDLGKTVLFITHDVEEAVLLSDRVYVLTPRPGRVRLELRVDLPRPRPYEVVTTPAFVALKEHLLRALQEERHALAAGRVMRDG